jgi:hypothetical protein
MQGLEPHRATFSDHAELNTPCDASVLDAPLEGFDMLAAQKEWPGGLRKTHESAERTCIAGISLILHYGFPGRSGVREP